MTNNAEAIEAAIERLFQIAKDNELLGVGSLPPLEMRITAAKSLGTYVPHLKAVNALIYLTEQSHAPKEIRIAAAESLAKK